MNQKNLLARLFALVMIMTGVHASYAQGASGSDGESADKKIMMIYDPAILTDENPSQGEKNAYDYFNNTYVAPDGYTKEVLSTAFGDTEMYPKDPDVVKCIWVHIDRDKSTAGWRQLPEAYTSSNFINKLRAYLLKGGNIYLSGQATELVVPLWRVNTAYSINHVEQNHTHVNENDPWKITVKFNSGRNGGDNSSHAVFAGLLGEGSTEIALFGGADTNDRSAKWKICDDQGNALFNFRWNNEDEDASSLERFEYDNLATVLASYNWDDKGQYATMVELHPLFAYDFAIGKWEKKSGSIITNSIGAYDFSAGSANRQQGNIEKLTGNILTYLSGTPVVLENQYPYYSPAFDGLDESIESTGRIALYIDCDSKDWEDRCKETKEGTDGVLKYEQEIAAYNYFMANFVNLRDPSGELKYRNAPAVVFKDQMNRLVFSETDGEGFECIWVNCDRDGLYKDEEGKPIPWRDGVTAADFSNLRLIFDMGNDNENGDPELITKLKEFTAAGGNLYLTKWANLMLGALGRTSLLPNQVTNLPKGDQTDQWGINILGQTDHPIYQHMDKEGTKIWLQSGTSDREDHNCLWWLKGTQDGVDYENLSNQSAIEEFETNYNARVLGTWGHDETYATRVAAIVEFFPKRQASANGPQRATPKSIVMQRRGTAIANGAGAYTWSSTSAANTQDRNVARLTTSILEYLTPVMVDDMYTGADEIESPESQNQKPVYYNLQGLRVDNPSGGIFIEVRGSRTRKVVL